MAICHSAANVLPIWWPALATVAGSYARFYSAVSASASVAPVLLNPAHVSAYIWSLQRCAIALQIARLNVRRLPTAKPAAAASKPKMCNKKKNV